MGDLWKEDVLVSEYLQQQCASCKWRDSYTCSNPTALGIAIRLANHDYNFEPASVDQDFKVAVRSLGCLFAFSISSSITWKALSEIYQDQTSVGVLSHGISVPVVDSLSSIPARSSEIKHSLGCLVRKEGIALIWADTVESALANGTDVEQMLVESIWGSSIGIARTPSPRGTTVRWKSTHTANMDEITSILPGRQIVPPRTPTPQTLPPRTPTPQTLSARTPTPQTLPARTPTPQIPLPEIMQPKEKSSLHHETKEEESKLEDVEYDPEAVKSGVARRPMLLTHSFMMSLVVILLFTLMAVILGTLVTEIRYDGNYTRLALLAVVPIYAAFACSSAITIINSLFQLFAPVSDNLVNSRYHSASAPNPARFPGVELPHITIQIPVFKEGLSRVIIPTIASVKAAVRRYESVGGTASIYINDDGMQVLPDEVAEARRIFYSDNDIGWCARPKHENGVFVRPGRFKKASNMNYALDFSCRVEDELARLVSERFQDGNEPVPNPVMSSEEENELYTQAFNTVLASDEGRTKAAGNVRIGEYILLIDCDTRVPVTCLQMAALEMAESPDVAIIQHTSGVLRVTHNVFEVGISYLTRLVYNTVQYSVASGDCAVFLGHNAFLRWKAVQSVAMQEDGTVKFWSDSHVSEDWHLSLRLQIAGFHTRLASYHGEDFKEGVSLTIYDEIARWEKYAYGCNELVFNPLYKWYKGPITSLYLKYYLSNVKPSSKLMTLSYTSSYYALAAALPLTFANYMFQGLMPNTIDKFYIASWKIFLVIVAVFNVLAPIAYCVIRFRLKQQSLQKSSWEALRSLPLIVLYFGGLSFHLSKAILCHFFSINMEWTSTAKELESTNHFVGIDRIFTKHALMYFVLFGLTAAMVYLGVYASVGWRITNWDVIVPLATQMGCHFLVPIILAF